MPLDKDIKEGGPPFGVKEDEVKKLFSMVQGVEGERLKGVFITSNGPVAFNKVDSVVTQVNLNALNDSRMEVISGRIDMIEGVEEALLECLAS